MTDEFKSALQKAFIAIAQTAEGKEVMKRGHHGNVMSSFFSEYKKIYDLRYTTGSEHMPFRRRIGMIFQSFHLVTRTTVIKNVLVSYVPDLPSGAS